MRYLGSFMKFSCGNFRKFLEYVSTRELSSTTSKTVQFLIKIRPDKTLGCPDWSSTDSSEKSIRKKLAIKFTIFLRSAVQL